MNERTIIINSGKCAWGGCTYCGWGRLVAKQKSLLELKRFWDEKLRDVKRGDLDRIKIFCSGCFLDDKQIIPAFRSYVVRDCERLGVKSLVVESFPRFIKKENLEMMRSDKVHILAGIGLEVGDDVALKEALLSKKYSYITGVSYNRMLGVPSVSVKEKKTVVMVTHDLSLAKYAERVIHIKDGKNIGG